MEILGHILREQGDYVICKLPCGNEIKISKSCFVGRIEYGYEIFMSDSGKGFNTKMGKEEFLQYINSLRRNNF